MSGDWLGMMSPGDRCADEMMDIFKEENAEMSPGNQFFDKVLGRLQDNRQPIRAVESSSNLFVIAICSWANKNLYFISRKSLVKKIVESGVSEEYCEQWLPKDFNNAWKIGMESNTLIFTPPIYCCDNIDYVETDIKNRVWGCLWFGKYHKHRIGACISCGHIFFDTRDK